jgi:hypothetical protein
VAPVDPTALRNPGQIFPLPALVFADCDSGNNHFLSLRGNADTAKRLAEQMH